MRAFSFLFMPTNGTVIINRSILSLLFIALIFESSASYGRNGRRSRAQSRRYEVGEPDEEWETSSLGLGLIGLTEEEESMTTNVYSNGENVGRRRQIRSPLDDEIDEVEDSDEDDDEEEESSSEKKTKASTIPPTTSIKPVVGPIIPAAKNVSINKVALNPNVNVSSPISAPHGPLNHPRNLANVTKGQVSANATIGFLPPGLPPKPNGNVTLHKPPPGPGGRRPPHGIPPFPGKFPPHGVPPFPGKLPPHLLKNLPKPKPPPKKGELYLPEDYNNLVIPKLNLGKLIGIDAYSAVPVLVFLNIRSVRDIDESMESETLVNLPWYFILLLLTITYEIVKVKRTSLMSKPLKLKFNPSNGFISYTTRLTVQLSCDMLYFYYPADIHRCEFTFRSYSYFSKDMELSWLGAGVYLQDPYDPNFDLQVESVDRIKLSQTFRKLTNDTFDGLQFTILARRKLSFHMVQTYLPSIFFIVITWLCFLVPARMVEARIGISMTTLLTLTSMFASVRESTPIVSYVKAIDIWMVFCIFFVFLTLLEFATLVWLRARREDAEEKKLEQQRKLQETRDNGKDKDKEIFPPRRTSSDSVELQKYEKFAELNEKCGFLIFSSVFVIFNIVYWSWLLTVSDYFDWSVNATLNAEVDN